MVLLFTAAIFVAAFLLFLIQPLAARLVLPHLGGSAAVWTGTMMLFQFLLLGGYAYAHAIGRLAPRFQAMIHGAVLASCVLFVPLALPGWWAPGDTPPLVALLIALAASVGVPFFAISSASPMIQAWFARTGHLRAHDPYFLYAASNAGSLLGLLAYPFAVEPLLGLRGQGILWSIGYALCAALLAACWLTMARRARAAGPARNATPAAPAGPIGGPRKPPGRGPAHPKHARRLATQRAAAAALSIAAAGSPGGTRLLWIALAAAPSSLSLGVTQYLSTDVAAIPLLWVVPLALYLLTYIVAFSRAGPAAERIGRLLLPIAAIAVTAAIMLQAARPLLVIALLNLLVLLAAGLACHGRLAAMRPAASRLTEFYLLASFGGALGGAFNAVVAPLLFDVVLEYPLAIAACCALLMLGESSKETSAPKPARLPQYPLVRTLLPPMLAVVAAGIYLVAADSIIALAQINDQPNIGGLIEGRTLGLAFTIGLPCIVAYVFSGRRLVYAALIAALAGQASLVPFVGPRFRYDILQIDRSFFGVCMVLERQAIPVPGGEDLPPIRSLRHGTTLHGQQFVDPVRRLEPLSYYSRRGPVGDLFSHLPQTPRTVAVIGLGVGSIAAYGRPGDTFDFFEIDPTVARIAQDPELFTFLAECAAATRVVLGDGRLRITDQPEDRYDLIVLDAFSSDSIPVHLLTMEAVGAYESRLKPGGALLMHTSNLHFDLIPPLARIARASGLNIIHRHDDSSQHEMWVNASMPSDWVVLSRDRSWLLGFARTPGWGAVALPPNGAAWTDNHANVLNALRWD